MEIRNTAGGIAPSYDPSEGGGGITFPGVEGKGFRMNLTNNFFETSRYGNVDYGDDIMAWLDITAHEVGHISDIHEISYNKWNYY